MERLQVSGRTIAYSDHGQGDAIVLVHGFAASTRENWERAGWLQMLVRANRRVVAVDLLGHGESDRPHDDAAYSLDGFAQDVLAVTEHLQLKKPDLLGFSLGARVVLRVLEQRPERYLLGVLCGVGDALLTPRSERETIALADALSARTAEEAPEGLARQFRLFAETQQQDLQALAACARGLNQSSAEWTRERVSAIKNEMFVVAGTSDELAGSAPRLAQCFPNAKGKQIPGCGHMDCLTQPMLKAAVMDFLAGVPG
jgi:pimeloyl-ACP methyl ester carboxylesterase